MTGTLIRYMYISVVAILLCLNFQSSFAIASPVQLPKTGQTASYGTRDDGALQKGVAWPNPRFTDNGNGTVTDNLTSLIWLKDAKCISATWDDALTFATSLASGTCGLSDGSKTGDWRIPNRIELKSLIVLSNYQALPSVHPFSNVLAYMYNRYWTSTYKASSPPYYSYAWSVDLSQGIVNTEYRSNSNWVWPVRGGQYSLDSLVITPPNAFDTQKLGSAFAPRTATLTNSGQSAITVTSITSTGASATDFSVTPGSCSSLSPTLAAGGSCTVQVTYSPTVNGSKSANFTIAANSQTLDIPLYGSVYTTISGTVIDLVTKNKLSAATVTLTGGATATTDVNGAFTFTTPPANGSYTVTINKSGYANTVINGVTVSDTQGATLNVGMVAPGSINIASPTNLLYGETGKPFDLRLPISGGTAPFTLSKASGTLPPGIILNSTGIGGTPTSAGSYTFAIGVNDSASGYAEQEYSMAVTAPLTISTASILPRGVKGTAYTKTIVASGGSAPYTFSLLYGTLPTGLTLNSSTGAISGTLAANATGTAFTIKVTDSAGRSVSNNISLPVDAPLTIVTTRPGDAIVGNAYNQTLTASGGYGSYIWDIFSGVLPDGLSLNSSTGVISGTATNATSQQIVVSVQDAAGRVVYKQFTLNALNPLRIETTAMPNAHVGDGYSELIHTSGGIGPFTFSYTGLLPSGLTLNTSTGIISGTPASASFVNLTLTVSDSSYATPQSVTQSLSVRTTSQMTITSGSVLPTARMGSVMNPVTLTVAGGTSPFTWSIISGALSPGLNLDNTTNTITGTPTTAGDYSFTIHLADSAGNATGTASNPDKQFFMHVSAPLTVSTSTVPTGGVGIPFVATLAATGGQQPYAWRIVTGTLPTGLTLNSTTGVVSGTPTAKITSSNVTFGVTDSDNPAQSAQKVITFNVSDTLSINETTLPNARSGQAYTTSIHAQLGTPPYSWRVSAGVKPDGLSLVQNAGIATLQGTATTSGTYDFTLEASDSSTPQQIATQQYRVITYDPYSIATASLKGAERTLPYFDVITVNGGVSPYAFSVVTGALPQGLALNSTTGFITGTPPAITSQSGTFTVRVTDSGSPAFYIDKVLSIFVTDPAPINGACGNSDGKPFKIAPTTNLCTSGVPSASGAWNWACTGQFSGTTASCSAIMDTTAPTLDVSAPANGSYTNNASLTVSGTATDTNGIQSVTVNGTAVTVSQTDGSFSRGITLTAGTNSITVVAIDKAGNQTTVTRTVTLDTTPPTVTVTPANGAYTNNASLTVSGVATDASGIQSVTVNGTTVTVAPADGSFSRGITLAAGANSITVIATDNAGNQTTVTRSVTLDTTPPALSISSLANGAYTNNATLNVSGTTTDASGIKSLTINGQTATVANDNSFTYPVTLTVGANTITTITTITTDNANNTTTDTRIINLDTSAPTLTISTPADNSLTNQGTTTVSGTVSETGTVQARVNSGSWQTAQLDGTAYSILLSLSSGQNNIEVTATDQAGNSVTTTVKRTVTYDNAAPQLAITDPNQDMTTARNSLTLAGTVSDALSATTISITHDGQTFTPTITSGGFSQQISFTTAKTYPIVVTATDAAGNSVSVTRNIIYAPYLITFAAGANGSLTGTTSQSIAETASSTAVTAVPNNGFGFVNWTGTGGFITTSANPLTVTNVTGPMTITANFATSVNGSCGASNNGTFTTVPTVNLCSTGTATAIIGTGPWSWNCTGLLGGTDSPACTAAIQTYAVTFQSGGSGTLSGNLNQTVNHGSATAEVTANPVGGYHFVNWTGTNSFFTTTSNPLTIANVTNVLTITANFVINPVNGACGSSSGQYFATAPTTNFCTAGNAGSVTGTGPWSWNCTGLYGGTTANCQALLDLTGPVLTLSTLADGSITNNATLNVSGTVSDVSGVAALTINNTGVTITNGSFSHPVTLQAGANTITTVATDTLGNGTTDTRSITMDTTAPVLTVSVPADNSKTAQGPATVTGTISETSTVTVKVNSGTPQSAAITGSSYSAAINLAGGLNTITITATDLAGNTSSAVRSVTYDNTNPSLAITNPNQDITTSQNSITISGTVSDTITSTTVTVTFNNQSYTPAITNGAFSQPLTIPAEGTYTLTATATDEAGNSSSVTRNLIYTIKSGIVNPAPGKTKPDLSDALRTLNIATGSITPTTTDFARLDVAPLDGSGKPKGDNVIDTYDVIGLLRMVVGLL
jgi:hypothetical protein